MENNDAVIQEIVDLSKSLPESATPWDIECLNVQAVFVARLLARREQIKFDMDPRNQKYFKDLSARFEKVDLDKISPELQQQLLKLMRTFWLPADSEHWL